MVVPVVVQRVLVLVRGVVLDVAAVVVRDRVAGVGRRETVTEGTLGRAMVIGINVCIYIYIYR